MIFLDTEISESIYCSILNNKRLKGALMVTAEQIKGNRIAEETLAREEKIRASIRRTRAKLMVAETDSEIERLHNFITMKKEELFALTEKCYDTFEIKFTKRKDYNDYLVTANYKYSTIDAIICKDKDTQGTYYWSSSIRGQYKYLKEIKKDITELLKIKLGA